MGFSVLSESCPGRRNVCEGSRIAAETPPQLPERDREAVPLSAARVSDASHYYEQSQPGKADLAHIGQHASTMYCNCGFVVCAIGANFWFCSSRDRSAPLTCA